MNKQILNIIIHLHKLRVSILVNRILYFTQKLPILGRLIHDRIYANVELKKALSILAIILQVIWGLSKAFLFLGLLAVYVPLSLSEEFGDNQLIWMLHIILWLSFIVSFISSSKVLEPTREKYIAVRQMRMSPTEYMQASLTFRYLTYAIYYILPMIVFFALAGGAAWQAVMLVLTLTFWRIISEIFHLKLYERSKLILIKHNGYVWTAIIIGYLVAYGLLIIEINPNYTLWLIHPFVAIPIIIAGLIAWIKLYRYSNFREIVEAATKHDDPLLNIGKMIADTQKTTIEKETGKIDIANTQALPAKVNKLKGYSYLHAIFMRRHRSLFAKKLKTRLIIIVAAGLLGTVVALVKPELAALLAEANNIILIYLYLIVSMFSIGSNAIYSFFYHCDVHLIGQSFYRQDAKKHYHIRLKMILAHNGMIAAALSLVASLMMYIHSGWLLSYEMGLMLVGSLAFSSFISIHQLFMYYLLQPYSADMKMKNPYYFLASLPLSFIWIMLILFQIRGLSFVAVFAALAIAYYVISMYIVNKYGHRTFRMK